MLSPLLFLAAPGPPPVRVAQVEVAVEARAVAIPPLPASVAEARKGFSAFRQAFEFAFRETDRLVAETVRDLVATGWVGSEITLPPAHAQEAARWSPFLFDQAYLTLEEPLLERWNTWQTRLLEKGMAYDRRLAGRMLLLTSSKQEVVTREGASMVGATLDIFVPGPTGPKALLRVRPKARWIEAVAVDQVDYASDRAFFREAAASADAEIRMLNATWKPLAAHLNRSAADLLELDHTASATLEPSVRALRLRARWHFLERFRSTLWFSQVVWAHMASQKILPIEAF